MSQQINLFNPLFLKQKKYFSAATMMQALGLVLLGLLALYGFARYQSADQVRLLAESDQRLAALRAQLATLGAQASPGGRSALLQDELARLEARLESRQALLAAISGEAAGSPEGYSGTMTAFARQASDGAWLTGFTVAADNSLLVKGRVLNADLVPAYLNALSREPVMRGRAVTSLKLSAMDAPALSAAAAAEKSAADRPQGPARFIEFDVRIAPRAAEPKP